MTEIKIQIKNICIRRNKSVMKAPDKIYILPMQNPADGYVGIAWSDKHGKMAEYVHKDALLKWAKETYLNENANAIRKVCYKQLIDKLNSM